MIVLTNRSVDANIISDYKDVDLEVQSKIYRFKRLQSNSYKH
jgi:hypothetical protein